MLPVVVDEEQIFAFNFWLNGSVRSGMCHQGKLYCRLASFTIQKRPQVYQLGCKLTQQQTAIVLSSSAVACSLWGSLCDPAMKRILLATNTSNLLEAMLLPQIKPGTSEHPLNQ